MSLLDALLDEDVPYMSPATSPTDGAKREVYIAIRKDGVVGSGSAADPYDGSTRVKLSDILNGKEKRQNTRFNFGPGIFKTAGGAREGDTLFDWLPLSGQEFIGAGMYATTLRFELLNETPQFNSRYSLIASHDPVNGVLISDMTRTATWATSRPRPPTTLPATW